MIIIMMSLDDIFPIYKEKNQLTITIEGLVSDGIVDDDISIEDDIIFMHNYHNGKAWHIHVDGKNNKYNKYFQRILKLYIEECRDAAEIHKKITEEMKKPKK
jgi:hypothetical protein